MIGSNSPNSKANAELVNATKQLRFGFLATSALLMVMAFGLPVMRSRFSHTSLADRFGYPGPCLFFIFCSTICIWWQYRIMKHRMEVIRTDSLTGQKTVVLLVAGQLGSDDHALRAYAPLSGIDEEGLLDIEHRYFALRPGHQLEIIVSTLSRVILSVRVIK